MKNKIVLSALATAFTASVAYGADTTTASQSTQPLTQEQLNSVFEQIDQLKAHVTKLQKQVNQQNAQQKAQEADIDETENRDEPESRAPNESAKQEAVEEEMEGISAVRQFGAGTGHEFGLDSSDDGTQLLITAPQLNKDYNLLRTNQFLNKEIGKVSEEGPRLQISGTVQASFEANSNPFGQVVDDIGNPIPEEKSDLLGQAEFDMAAEINDWWTGYMHFYSDTQPSTNVGMEQAFIVLGNLDELPTYASAGLMFLPNGSFYTNMVTRPLTREIGRQRDNAAVLGTTWEGWRANIFGFDSERQLSEDGNDSVNQWGASFDYNTELNEDWKVGLGAGYVNDNSGAEAIAASNVLEFEGTIQRHIPAVNVHGRVDYGPMIFFAEYQDNLRAFQEDEISFNHEGAKISAGNFEVTYNFDCGRPSWLTANYGFTTEALGAQLPRNQYGVTYGVIVLKNTILSFEYLLQNDYSEDDVAKARDEHHHVHGHDDINNQFIAQVDVFF
jgi:hypothetical protein